MMVGDTVMDKSTRKRFFMKSFTHDLMDSIEIIIDPFPLSGERLIIECRYPRELVECKKVLFEKTIKYSQKKKDTLMNI